MVNENITLIIVDENDDTEHICNCDVNDKTIEHGPLCPGAIKPPNLPIEEPVVETIVIEIIPKIIFIIPYRDREQQMIFFKQHMNYVLEDMKITDYKILYIHQQDNREFNRGAMKNIGYIVVKEKYPNDYKNITLVFNDIDTMPFTKNFLNYETVNGTVKHFYGFNYALGGIVSITAGDFEKVGGFPNFWAWGYEDNLLNTRVKNAGLHIDRTQFYPTMDKNIIQMNDGLLKTVNKGEFDRFMGSTKEGWHSITSLEYKIIEDTGFVNVSKFNTGIELNKNLNKVHDLRDGVTPFGLLGMSTRTRKPIMGMRLL